MTAIEAMLPGIVYGEPIRIVEPAMPAVSYDDALGQCNLTDDRHDATTIYRIMRSATSIVENDTGLGLIEQTWQQTVSAFPSNGITLWRRPLVAVDSLAYLDGDGNEQFIDPSAYQVSGIGGARVNSVVRAAFGATWPTLYGSAEAIRVTYTVGFGTSPEAVPEDIRHAVLMWFGTLFENRENVVEGRGLTAVPFAADHLLRHWRPLAVA